jgi:hypothetical protein
MRAMQIVRIQPPKAFRRKIADSRRRISLKSSLVSRSTCFAVVYYGAHVYLRGSLQAIALTKPPRLTLSHSRAGSLSQAVTDSDSSSDSRCQWHRLAISTREEIVSVVRQRTAAGRSQPLPLGGTRPGTTAASRRDSDSSEPAAYQYSTTESMHTAAVPRLWPARRLQPRNARSSYHRGAMKQQSNHALAPWRLAATRRQPRSGAVGMGA